MSGVELKSHVMADLKLQELEVYLVQYVGQLAG